jgi:hypothetical protein
MLLFQMLPKERHPESTLPQKPLTGAVEMRRPQHESVPAQLEAIRLPAPPAAAPAEPAPQPSAEEVRKAESTEVEASIPALTPLQPRPMVNQAQDRQSASEDENIKIEVTENNLENVRQGRALLKILEYGEGPGIEIAWPADTRQRESLYRLLHRCYGMRTAMMDQSGLLFRSGTPAGQPWRPNLDRFSGFVRQPKGYLARQEAREANQITQLHRLGSGARPVRLFPRRSDALLLGGLQQLLGAGYETADQIQGVYLIDGPNLSISSIRKDNRPVAGRIDLTGAQRCR